MPSKFATENENVSTSGGRLRPPDQGVWGTLPRIPLGDPSQRRRAIYALEARAPQTVLQLWLIVCRTELTVSL